MRNKEVLPVMSNNNDIRTKYRASTIATVHGRSNKQKEAYTNKHNYCGLLLLVNNRSNTKYVIDLLFNCKPSLHIYNRVLELLLNQITGEFTE